MNDTRGFEPEPDPWQPIAWTCVVAGSAVLLAALGVSRAATVLHLRADEQARHHA